MHRNWFCLGALLFAGCTTTVDYQPKAESGPAKPADYPIYVYPGNIRVPRKYEIVGSVRVDDTPFTVKGGSLEAVVETLRKQARKQGADAVKLTALESPDYLSPNHRARAQLIRFTDVWENYPLSDAQILGYLHTNAPSLDPIEGVWSGNDAVHSRVVIWKNNSNPGRDFVALILNSANPTWHLGDKKMDLRRGERAGVYRANFFMDDYQPRQVAISWSATPSPHFYFLMPGETVPIMFIKEYAKQK
jgi:hypothetical protein